MSLKTERLLNRAQKLSKNGEIEKAREAYLSILKISPDNLTAKKELSSLDKFAKKNLAKARLEKVMKKYSLGLFHEALSEVNLLIKDFPEEPVLFNISGACYSEIGPNELAIEEFQKAISLKPDYAEAYFNLGVVLQKIVKDDDAFRCYEKAIDIRHKYPNAHNNIGLLNLKQKKFDTAISNFEWAIAYDPKYFEAYNNLGAALQELVMYKKAKEQYEKALEINPNFAPALNNLGAICEILGLKEQALDNYMKAIDNDPSYTVAYRNLSAIKKFQKNDYLISQMESLYSKSKLSNLDKRNLCFALAKANQDLENNEKFFKFLNKGNQIRKKELNYSFSSSLELYSNLLKAYKSPPKSISKTIRDSSNICPIFIVGMPRSGTTLVEQIISSHYLVHGAGELNNIKNIVSPILVNHLNSNEKTIIQKDIQYIRQKYLDSLKQLNTKKKIITDKMPINFWFIGFILSAIPEAKIIHVKRDARATCWSNYKHCFTSGNGFTFNQKDLFQFFGLYSQIIDFWHKLFPNKIYDLSYEELTVNQKIETEKLLKFCDLKWDENCLEFYKNNRAIKTASASQVRQKMYQGSSEEWKKYKPFLKTLIDGLKSY